MPEISSGGAKRLRLPPPFEGVNVNFCKNPLCPNFGVHAEIEDQRSKNRHKTNERSSYIVTGSPHEASLAAADWHIYMC